MDRPEQIIDAYRKLLSSRDYNSITVSDICDSAGVSRKTFYKYFIDKTEVISAMFHIDIVKPTEDLKKVLPYIEVNSMSHVMIENMYQRIYNSRSVYENLLSNMGMVPFGRIMGAVILAYSGSDSKRYQLSEEERDYAAQLLAYAQVGIIVNWIERGMKIPPSRMAKYCHTWLTGTWDAVALKSTPPPLKSTNSES